MSHNGHCTNTIQFSILLFLANLLGPGFPFGHNFSSLSKAITIVYSVFEANNMSPPTMSFKAVEGKTLKAQKRRFSDFSYSFVDNMSRRNLLSDSKL